MGTARTRDRRRRRRGIALLTALAVAGGGATAAGAMLGLGERTMAEQPPRSADRAGGDAGSRREARPEAAGKGASAERGSERETAQRPRIEWRRSRAVGLPHAGRLVRGVQLPYMGRNFFTWDPIRKRKPNRGWRRWGTDRLVRTTLRVVREYAADNPRAPRVAIGDMSRPRGGDFGPQYGAIGHASHQSGLDVDIYYPRRDGRERAPKDASQIDRALSQDLVDRFVRAGAEKVFVGPNTALKGPPKVVVPLVNHDNHIHVRIPG